MAWTIPENNRTTVNAAALWLARTEMRAEQMGELSDALDVINNWRAAHSFPLNAFKVTLQRRAKAIDRSAILSQRLKRLESIRLKLERFPDMKLTQMQDIGGCRAVLKSVRAVRRMAKVYKEATAKNPNNRQAWLHDNDYIKQPKEDGYRSYHMIFRYRSRSKKNAAYDGQKIEIQLRSRLQHAWATAVETVSIFTEQALKSGGGNVEWRRFFALMASALAHREHSALVPNTPQDHAELIAELRKCVTTHGIRPLLLGWSRGVQMLEGTVKPDTVAYLLTVDAEKRVVFAMPYSRTDMKQANEDYLAKEREIRSTPGSQAVLVSVDSLRALRVAYPNFYLDTGEFVNALDAAIGTTI